VQDVAHVSGRWRLLVTLDEHGLWVARQKGGRAGDHDRPRMNAAKAVVAVWGALPALVIVRTALRAYLAHGGVQQGAGAAKGGEEHQENAEPEPEHRGPSNTSAMGMPKRWRILFRSGALSAQRACLWGAAVLPMREDEPRQPASAPPE
jgi:hypothetical protein